MRIKGIVYGSSESRVKNTSIVIAQLEAETRPARIEYFAKVSTELLARSLWFLSIFSNATLKKIFVESQSPFGNATCLIFVPLTLSNVGLFL